MDKKECYRHNLPHFQQPGQWYFITCILQNSMPVHVLSEYSEKVHLTLVQYKKLQKDNPETDEFLKAKSDYYIKRKRYLLLVDKLLAEFSNRQSQLSKEINRLALEDALKFWDGKRLTNHAWCIMPNHFHWVITLFEKNEKGKTVYLQDILHSVKLFSAKRINANENLAGQFWMHESFETTIRNDKQFQNAVNYTIKNPVKAGFVKNWWEWPGNYIADASIIE